MEMDSKSSPLVWMFSEWLIISYFHYLNFQEDLDTIDKMIEEGEAAHNKWRHPDPYIGQFLIILFYVSDKRISSNSSRKN